MVHEHQSRKDLTMFENKVDYFEINAYEYLQLQYTQISITFLYIFSKNWAEY